MNNLRDLLVASIQDLYSAENQIVDALPDMAAKATNPELRMGFEKHTQQSQVQAQRLEQIAQMMGINPDGESCLAMEGLVEEAQSFLDEDLSPEVCDAGMIGMAQKIEHYEIASYGTAITWARQIGNTEAAQLMQLSLDEEKKTDQMLTELAERSVNAKAEQA